MDKKVEFALNASVNYKTGEVTIEHFLVNGGVLAVGCSLVAAFEEIGFSLGGPISFTKYIRRLIDSAEVVSRENDCDRT